MSEKNVDSMRAAVEAFNRRDVAAAMALFAEDAEIVPIRAALEGTVYRGPAAVSQWYEAVDESWDELSAEIEDVRAAGDRVVALGRIRGHGHESGAAIDVEAASVAHFRAGLISSLRHYTNRTEALEAAGMSE